MTDWFMSPWAKYDIAVFVIAVAGLISIWRARLRQRRDRLDQRVRTFQGGDIL